MLAVTNPKVAGSAPRWSRWPGFTVLFDNPGHGLVPQADRPMLRAEVDHDPALGLYRALRGALADLDPALLTATFGFCPLPPHSYHVTVWDGVNPNNLDRVVADERTGLAGLIAAMPDGRDHDHPALTTILASPLVTTAWPIAMRYARLTLWDHSALVAEVAPADAASAKRLEELVALRRALSAHFRARYGIAPGDDYRPHITLGYFASREGAQLALPQVAAWEEHFAPRVTGQTIAFSRASLYGFTDMATFFTGTRR